MITLKRKDNKSRLFTKYFKTKGYFKTKDVHEHFKNNKERTDFSNYSTMSKEYDDSKSHWKNER